MPRAVNWYTCIDELKAMKAEHDDWADRLKGIDAKLNSTPEAQAKLKDRKERYEIANNNNVKYTDIQRDLQSMSLDD